MLKKLLLSPLLLCIASLELTAADPFEGHAPVPGNRPVLSGGSKPDKATFIDPTAQITGAGAIEIGCQSYIGPFAFLVATDIGNIRIGDGSNIQDNVTVMANDLDGAIEIGDHVIIAHGTTIRGGARIGRPGGLPTFISFNAVVDGSVIEPDAVVSALARVAPGVIIRSKTKVLPGKFVQTQAQADNRSLGKVTDVNDDDREFMKGVLHVNESFARGYTELFQERGMDAVTGINFDPGNSDFSPTRDLPAIGGISQPVPGFRNRIIGKITTSNTLAELDAVTGTSVAIRSDEGKPITVGSISYLSSRSPFHALEHTGIQTGRDVVYGFHSVIHDGADDGNSPKEITRIGDGVSIGHWSVVFRSTLETEPE